MRDKIILRYSIAIRGRGLKLVAAVVVFVSLVFPVYAEEDGTEASDPLVAIVEACQDALALGDRSTAFSIARKIRTEALLRFSNEPRQLAPLLLLYADAAASYKDTGALVAYREAIAGYENAFGDASEQLIEPLIRAGREALARKYRVEAFALFRRVVELSDKYNKSDKSQGAIAKTGIASLHLRVGELGAARRFLDEALIVDERSISTLDLGWIYHVSADTHLAMENWEAANNDYTQAYGLYEAVDEYSRDLRSILKQLVKVSHKMGQPERAVRFCQMYARKRDWGSRMLYDPSEKITAWRGNNVVPVATVGVEYTINSNCRAVDVVVTRDGGMDVLKIKKIVENAYWLPRYRNGEFAQTGLQRISSFIINE